MVTQIIKFCCLVQHVCEVSMSLQQHPYLKHCYWFCWFYASDFVAPTMTMMMRRALSVTTVYFLGRGDLDGNCDYFFMLFKSSIPLPWPWTCPSVCSHLSFIGQFHQFSAGMRLLIMISSCPLLPVFSSLFSQMWLPVFCQCLWQCKWFPV